MIEIKEQILESLINRALASIGRKDKQFVSLTKKVDAINPLHFFERAKNWNTTRMFWTSSFEDFYVVGIGTAYEISVTEDRFKQTEVKWNEFVKKAIIHNPYKVPGTGLLAIGGMAFDPRKNKTALWKNFQPSQFNIPEFLLTISEGSYYLTINIAVEVDDDVTELVNQLEQKELDLLQKIDEFPAGAGIKGKYEIAPEKWKDTVRLATEEITNQNVEKIVLAREMRIELTDKAEITPVIQQLIETQPNSYVFAFEHADDCFIGATPERLVKIEQHHLLSTCLAGTAPRGKTTEEDENIAYTLLHDAKNRQEHEFVVKMIKQAIEKYCFAIHIPEEPVIYPLQNLQHLYTPVTATLKEGHSVFDIIKQLHPTPALGGTPKEEALAFIREHELLDRGWYGAPIGWFDSNQNSEFAVAIRSGLIRRNEVSLFAGCGVVKDSEAEAEYEETNIKFLPMLSVLGG